MIDWMSYFGPGLAVSSFVLILCCVLYFIFREFLKARLIKLGVWLIMNHLGALDTDSVEKRVKHVRVKFTYLGAQYMSIIPLGKLPRRGRKLHIQEGQQLVDITCIRGAKYKFTPNEIGVDKILLTESKTGQTVVLKTFEADDEITL